MPSAAVALAMDIDSMVSSVATVWPRALASAMVSTVSSGDLDWDVVDVGRILDAGILHREADTRRDLLDARRTADILGRDRFRHGDAHGEPFGLRVGIGIVDAREHVDVRRDDAGAAARQRDRNPHRGLAPPAPPGHQEVAQHPVDQDAAEIVDPAIALGLGDERHDVVDAEPLLRHRRLDAGGVLNALHRNLADDYGHDFSLRISVQSVRRRLAETPPRLNAGRSASNCRLGG